MFRPSWQDMPAPRSVLTWGLSLLFLSASPAAAVPLLIGVDFQAEDGGSGPQNMSGVEPTAAAAYPQVFAQADEWNHFDAKRINNPPLNNGVVLPNLKDSTGAPTGVTLTITGTFGAFNTGNRVLGDTLTGDYLNLRPDLGSSSTINWQLSGLLPSAPYALWLYGVRTTLAAPANNLGFQGRVDLDGDSLLTDQILFTNTGVGQGFLVWSDANGIVRGSVSAFLQGSRVEAHWGGFQLGLLVPELSSIWLLLGSQIGLVGYVWKKRLSKVKRSQS